MLELKKILRNIGPGLLFASMAIGTSHLVLSTKAGAQYGWVMLFPIVLANILKYPFFEFGVRYTNITNTTLIEGYLKRGKYYLWFYAFITFITTFTILAALYTVTAGLFINLFKTSYLTLPSVALVLFIIISALLSIGKYKLLESSLKIVISILFVALLATTAIVLYNGKITPISGFEKPSIFDETGILFLIGLMGWMPTTVEASSWVSLWSVEKYKLTGEKLPLKEALLEFKTGYFITGLLAIFFLIIGWFTLYGSNIQLSGSAIAFADQLTNLFTTSIGSWSYYFIAIAAFCTMFSTCITAHDALARVSIDIIKLSNTDKSSSFDSKKSPFIFAVLILAIINYVVIALFSANMGQLIALATFVSFIVAPIIGYMNYKNVMSDDIPANKKPKKALQILTFLGIAFLTLFSIYYLWIVLL